MNTREAACSREECGIARRNEGRHARGRDKLLIVHNGDTEAQVIRDEMETRFWVELLSGAPTAAEEVDAECLGLLKTKFPDLF